MNWRPLLRDNVSFVHRLFVGPFRIRGRSGISHRLRALVASLHLLALQMGTKVAVVGYPFFPHLLVQLETQVLRVETTARSTSLIRYLIASILCTSKQITLDILLQTYGRLESPLSGELQRLCKGPSVVSSTPREQARIDSAI
jgi:hypothetical protein